MALSKSRNPRLHAAQDLGRVASGMAFDGVTLVFRRSIAQETALKDLLAAQQDLSSPLYHHWLTPETFAAQFGVSDQDIATTENWLISFGFRIDSVARSHDRITFSGTAAQVESAFGADLHRYQTEGQVHFAPASDLTLPANLAALTAAILHLSDFRPKPSIRGAMNAIPGFTEGVTQAHYLGPKDILTMYSGSALYNRYIYGAGQSVAVVGQSYVNTGTPSSIDTFQVNLAQSTYVSPVLVPGSGVEAISPGDQGESELDLEYASGIAQNATIFFVHVGDRKSYSVFDAITFAIAEKIAPVISISYGECEPLMSPSDLAQYDAVFEQASAQGQTLVAAAGDSGSTACAQQSSTEATTAQQEELAVSFPASSPNVTAVGGTQMAPGTFAAGSSTYWGSANPSDNTNSLLSYVPEEVWNEGSAKGIVAGGGGTSTFYPRPAWQSSYPNIPAGTYRLVPDIALQSSVASPGFLVCVSDQSLLRELGQTASCTNGLQGSNSKLTIAGGTSFAAPIFAGFLALLNEAENATGLGNINPTLYHLATDPGSYGAAFHDITSGTNACIAGAAKCIAAGQASYAASPGYDDATGLGSVDFNALATAWPKSSAANLQSTVLLIIGSATTATAGQTIPLQIYADPLYNSSGTTIPTGNVSISLDGIASSSLALSETNASSFQAGVNYSYVAPATTGSHLITVQYPGDATHSPATATYPVLVGNVLASGSFSLSAGNLTIPNGGSGSTQVTVTPAGGYSGRVTWSLTAISGGGSGTACYAIPSLVVSSISMTTLKFGIGTACQSAQAAGQAEVWRLGRRTAANRQASPDWQSPRATMVSACLLLCGCLTGRRRKWLLLCVFLISMAGAGVLGCGGGGGAKNSGGSTPTPPAAPAVLSVTLSGTDSVNTAIVASTTFTVTVD